MAYEEQGTLRTGRMSPVDNTIEIEDLTEVDLENLVEINGVIKLRQSTWTIDNFNSADTDNSPGVYQEGEDLSDYYDGQFSSFERVTENSTIGDHSVRLNDGGSGSNDYIESRPGDGLEHYPEQGDEIEIWYYTTDTAGDRSLFAFAVGSTSDFDADRILIFFTTSDTRLRIGGDDKVIEETLPPSNEWVRVQVTTEDNIIDVSIFGEEGGEWDNLLYTLSAEYDDSEWFGNGISFGVNDASDTDSYFDGYSIGGSETNSADYETEYREFDSTVLNSDSW